MKSYFFIFQRKPLATSNRIGGLSKLPMPGSRLKPPSSTTKRARSPEIEEAVDINSGKKRCLEKPAPALALPKTNTTKSLAKTSAKSSSNLRSTTNTSRRPLASTKPNNKSVSTLNRPSRPMTNTRPPAVGGVVKKPVSTGISKTKPPAAAAPARSSGSGSKRPGWDLKGRLQDMEALVLSRENMSAELQSQLESYNKRIFSLESHNQQLTGTVREKEQQTQDNTAEISNLRRQIREAEDSLDCTKRRLQREIEDLTFSKSTLERQKETLSGELSANQAEITGLKSSIAELTSTQAKSAAELEGIRINLTDANSTIKARDGTIAELKELVRQHEEKIKEQELKLIEQETTRRQLHNTIQELKGNIRVFCRVRPLLGKETIGNDGIITHMNFPDTDGKILEMDKIGDATLNESTLLNSTRGASKYEFNFDKVFDPTSTQASVFEEISQLVQSALDGYNVCIFAYGQTGSGKTYTMEGGGLEEEKSMGMIPRAVQQIFATGSQLQEKGWQYEFLASMLEIYNETIHDLLSERQDIKHEVKMKGKDTSDVYVTNLTTVPVKQESEVLNLLKQASHNRAVAETKCNERSSRSHSVFQLHLTGNNTITGEALQGTLNLVDLAGSERLKESGSEGQRLKETLSINKSLSNLGNVIMALGRQESHVPYRNSKLTYLLQNSLGGNSKTLMFVNINPREEYFNESLNSLRFATKVNQCNIGTAQKKIK
ncbi:hypothetical protein SNE40_002016 [Patella caerulea]|uniref:Kinesin-like protein n=1 Tax=Patella caerulea TaxID=87958 RepID=A0AAN8KBG9_PATCE